MKKLGRLILASVVAVGLATSAQAVDYWTGGAGIESREMAPDYNTAIEFFGHDGSYLSEIWFTVYNAHGDRMLEGMTEGPWLLVDLDDGTYSVKGQRMATGEVQSIRFHVEGGRTQLLGLQYHEEN
ncbi:hypothetical protein E4656_16880 [Natronospirillum operosum]|uniref:Uncharacterized protein n=1 Tax=Natronospirillum operosum TaxID=2759953 RepID=A0A4Z0W5C2_9GAMM|nr:hypothetical protein [Natronospirillum operosum]TGG91069.1 hypothetical protein E4656_16880 [Natronospirillum operosum]